MHTGKLDSYERILVVGPYLPEWVKRFVERGASFITAENARAVEKAMESVQAVFIYSPLDSQVSSSVRLCIANKARRLKITTVVAIMLPDSLEKSLEASLLAPPAPGEVAESEPSDYRLVESIAPEGWEFKSYDCINSIRRTVEKIRPTLNRNRILNLLSRIRDDRMRAAGVSKFKEPKRRILADKTPANIVNAIASAAEVEIPNDLITKALRSGCATPNSFIRRVYRAEAGFTDYEWAKAIGNLARKNGFPGLRDTQIYMEIQGINRRRGKRVEVETKEEQKAS